MFTPNSNIEILNPGPPNVTVLRDRVFKEVIKFKGGHLGGA